MCQFGSSSSEGASISVSVRFFIHLTLLLFGKVIFTFGLVLDIVGPGS